MGRRRNRKRERRWAQDPAHDLRDAPKIYVPPDDSNYSLLVAMARGDSPAPARSCGSCREFIEDQEGGRGTCLHPGSGVLSPWTDTPACDFHDRVRNMDARR